MSTEHPTDHQQSAPADAAGPVLPRGVLWLAGLLVALGAAVATAHGLYEVAFATGTGSVIAALYPLITDGLAVVAYAATTRLTGRARAYAWGVVILAAGLSGLAQASYMADATSLPPSAHSTTRPAAHGELPGALRFGVGAWPALAAAIVAHLLFLIGTHTRQPVEPAAGAHEPLADAALNAEPSTEATVQLSTVHSEPEHPPVEHGVVERPAAEQSAPPEAVNTRVPVNTSRPHPPRDEPPASAFDRARQAAETHATTHGHLPTVSQLVELAEVSRGTAHNALKPLRERPAGLHIVHDTDENRHLR